MPGPQFPAAQAEANQNPPTGAGQRTSGMQDGVEIFFCSVWQESRGKWRWLNSVSAKTVVPDLSAADVSKIRKRRAAGNAQQKAAGKRPSGWTCSNWGGTVDDEDHPYVLRIYSMTKGHQEAADAIVALFKNYMRSLVHDGSIYQDTCRDHLKDMLEKLQEGKLAFAVTDVETGRKDKRLKEACILIAKLQLDGTIAFETLCNFKEKERGAGISQRQQRTYDAALRAAQLRGLKVVHHGGCERNLCEQAGLDLDGVANQLGIFQFALGYIGSQCPLPDDDELGELRAQSQEEDEMFDPKVRYPLSMAGFCFTILRESQRHTARQDCLDQATVLVYMLSALLKVYRAAAEI